MKTTRLFRSLLASAFAVGLITTQVKAQGPAEPFSPYGSFSPSAESWLLTRHGGLTPSLHTGVMTFSLPLYTYIDPDFTIPISLEYAFEGYRPAQHSGTIGYGWALNCGGVITREVRGVPDEGDLRGNASSPKGWQSCFNYMHFYTAQEQLRLRSINCLQHDYLGSSQAIPMLSGYDIFSDIPIHQLDLNQGGSNVDAWRGCDTVPDIYSFNFMGHHGSFMVLPDGVPHVFNSDIPEGELTVRFVGHSPAFKISITSGDGTEYLFNQADIAVHPNIYGIDEHINSSLTCYRLERITAPNGRTAIFRYDSSTQCTASAYYPTDMWGTYNMYISDGNWDEHDFRSAYDYPRWTLSAAEIRTLSSISIDSVAEITFCYDNSISSLYDEQAQNNFDHADLFGAYLSGGIRPLEQIQVRNSAGNIVERITLNHMFAESGTPKMFLSSVSSTNEGTHSFAYNTDVQFPKNDTQATDHWGFWNGQDISDLRTHLKGLSTVGAQMIITPEHYEQGPDPDSLIIISADTTWVMEKPAHLYDQLIDDCKNPNFNHSIAGALTEITYPTGGSTFIEYEDNIVDYRINCIRSAHPVPQVDICTQMQAGGVRVKRLTDYDGTRNRSTIYSYTGGILMHMPVYYEKTRYIHTLNNMEGAYHTGCVMNVNTTAFTAATGTLAACAPHVCYSEVSVLHPDHSKTTYSFSTVRDYPDSYDGSPELIEKRVFCSGDIVTEDESPAFLAIMTPPTVDRSAMRGRVICIVDTDSGGNVVKTVCNNYQGLGVGFGKVFHNNIQTYSAHSVSFAFPRLIGTVQSMNGITNSTGYVYNGFGQIKSLVQTNRLGATADSLITDVTYLHEGDEHVDTPLKAAVASFIIRRTGDLQGGIVQSEERTYDSSSRNPNPVTVTTNDRTIRYSWDPSSFRLTRVDGPGDSFSVYHWDSSGVFLLSHSDNDYENTTNYGWMPLVGLSSVAYPDGRSERYDYFDHCGRLRSIYDSSNRMKTSFSYELENE